MEEQTNIIWLILFIFCIAFTVIAAIITFVIDAIDRYKHNIYKKNGYTMGNIRVSPERFVYGIKRYDRDTDIMRYIPIGEFYSIKASKLKKMIEEDEVHEIYCYEKGE